MCSSFCSAVDLAEATAPRGRFAGWPTGPAPEEGRPATMRVLDRLCMFVTADPVAEVDQAIADVVRRRDEAAQTGDALTSACLSAWLDHLLDDRSAFRDIRAGSAVARPS